MTKPKEELFCKFEFEYQMDVRTMYSKGLPSVLGVVSLGNNQKHTSSSSSND